MNESPHSTGTAGTFTMRKTVRRMLEVAAVCGAVVLPAAAHAQAIDWAKVDGILGRTAAVGGAVHRYGFPRTDLQVTLDGVTIRPTLALGGWVAFEPMGNMAMAMGDIVLLQSEVNPVMAKLIEGGLEVTAVHNHLLRSEPLTFYMHVGGHGDPVKMAETLHNALAVSKTPLTITPPAGGPPAIDLDTAQIDQILGAKGANNGGVYAVNVPRRDPITEQRNAGRRTDHGRRNCHQLPADRRRQGRDHRRLRAHRHGGSRRDPCSEVERHRGNGDPQPHAHRGAQDHLHALLGERRRHQARQGAAGRARQDCEREELGASKRRRLNREPPPRRDNGAMNGEVASVLEVVSLSKRYAGQPAIADVDLSVRPGEVLGLIGPNGAGKTTLLEFDRRAFAGRTPDG